MERDEQIEPISFQNLIDILTYYATLKLICAQGHYKYCKGHKYDLTDDHYQNLAEYYNFLSESLNTKEQEQSRTKYLKDALKEFNQLYLTQEEADCNDDRALEQLQKAIEADYDDITSETKVMTENLMLNSINTNLNYMAQYHQQPLNFLPVGVVLLLERAEVIQANLTLQGYDTDPNPYIDLPKGSPTLSITDQQNALGVVPKRYNTQLETNPITKTTISDELTRYNLIPRQLNGVFYNFLTNGYMLDDDFQ
ncbi:MAG: hypothetical protein [Caudoviricetes sp.]|nr:MAG: hypothetical protein [Caudoviricetes sp.]